MDEIKTIFDNICRKIKVCAQKVLEQFKNLADSPKRTKIIVCMGAIVAIFFLVIIFLLLSHSPSANKTLDGFVDACANGDVEAMEDYELSEYSYFTKEQQEFISLMQDEYVSDSDITVSQSDAVTGLQTTIMCNSKYEAKTIWTINKSATAHITITGPDIAKIMEQVYLIDGIFDMSSEDVLSIIESMCLDPQYITVSKIDIPMQKINGIWYIDYNNTQTIDKLTGGLVTVYGEAYLNAAQEMIGYYKEILSNSDVEGGNIND